MAKATHHHLSVDRTLGGLHLTVDLPLYASWTLLFGPSGSGKSSLLRAACGLLGPAGIRFLRGDTPLITPEHATPPHQLALAYAPQGGALFPHLNVEKNVAFSLSTHGNTQPRNPEVASLLEVFEIAPLRTRLPGTLSGGERQRVNLARAFAAPNARLLLLDEPFAGMGRELRNRLLARMITGTQQRNLPVLSVSHDVDEALLLRAEVAVLEAGQLIRRGPADEALADEREQMLTVLNAAPI